MTTSAITDSELSVRVRAPSRLHFGLLAFGPDAPRQFGGVGVMIDQPATQITLSFGRDRNAIVNASAALRAEQFATAFMASLPEDERRGMLLPTIRVDEAAPPHVGLGSGTALGMAVARAMSLWTGRSEMPPEELARRVGRGRRSAIGVHGFNLGGFLVEAGKRDSEAISPLVARLTFPPDWHFVLIIPNGEPGLSGDSEREAFDRLDPISDAVTADLCRLTMLGILPALADRDFAAFSESFFEFGEKVGRCFAACQGGVYASPLAPDVIALVHREGIRGVAQSSWGPTLAAVADSRFRAEWLAARLRDALGRRAEILCTAPNNLGAKVEIV